MCSGHLQLIGLIRNLQVIDTMKGPRIAFGIILGNSLTKTQRSHTMRKIQETLQAQSTTDQDYVHSF
jgi:hypothetical protein